MHHSDKNVFEINGIDITQDRLDDSYDITEAPAFMESYIYQKNDQFMLTDNIFADRTVQDSNTVLSHGQTNKIHCNIRLTSLGKRLSNRYESENQEPGCLTTDSQKSLTKNGKKSCIVGLMTLKDIPEQNTFEFVQKTATKFGRGISSSDVHFDNVSDSDDIEDDDSDSSENVDSTSGSVSQFQIMFQPLTSSNVGNISSNYHLELQETTTDSRTECLNNYSSQQSPSIQRRLSSTLQNKKDRSVLLDQLDNPFLFANADDLSPLRAEQYDPDVHEIVLACSSRNELEEPSVDDSAYLSASDSDANVLASNILTNDGKITYSQNSYQSDDDLPPSPASFIVDVQDDVQDEETVQLKSCIDKFQQDIAFSQYVNLADIRTSLGHTSVRTERSLAAKYEKQLEVLLKGGSLKALKAYLRNSQWPADSCERHHLWERLCNHLHKAEEHLYQKLVDDMLSEDSNECWILPSLVDPDNSHSYFLTAGGMEHAKTVVNLISHLHPDITYCPVLYPMSCLFLHYMSPEACFNCLQALLASTKFCYFTQTKVKTEATKYVLRDLAKKYAKPAYDLMTRSGESVEVIFGNWTRWIFRDLPFQYLVRIVDSFLLEGYKIFYRISLAIVIFFAKGYRNHNSPKTDIVADISKFCTNMSIDPRKLIQVGFGIRGLSRKDISKLHEKIEMYLMSLPAITAGPILVRLPQQVPSEILTQEMFQSIWQWIPVRLSLMKPTLLFSSNEHGTSIRTLYSRTEHADQTILTIKTTNNEIFGAFCSSSWVTRHEKNNPKLSFFGTGETFVFSISPEVKRYPWCGLLADPPEHTVDLFMAGDDHMMTIGSGNGTAIYLDAMMNRGSSTHCETFNNNCLCHSSDFSCHVVEVFGFIE